jgi:ferric-chelate reductase
MRQHYALLLLALLVVVTAGFTLGLTYATCYASLCSEEFFPVEVRLHIASYYALIASIGFALVLRAYTTCCRNLSAIYLTQKPLPVFDKRLSLGGAALIIWILGIVLAVSVIDIR